ncbi:capsular polysaccharide biosynthesis protein [Eleftheria terrae]|uniref:capsular polysaccharide biosynthesis protein n=1 Tax=Eleftheria terrae TaxID=1597781 RepID=UPI00263BA39A|nr:capsular polysaccharide biosynthesis protein [Eleftheria terrae]WKB55168.1 capsular polysaccharide biosynthesis protein [Eleftheria terrae]
MSGLDIGLWSQPHLQRLLGHAITVRPGSGHPGEVVHIGWGMRRSGVRAAARAAAAGQACWRLEDGFLRSLGLGRRALAWSVLVDDIGIYYRADHPSRLEALVSTPASPEQAGRAAALAAGWCRLRLSKYNHAREAAPPVPDPYVLVVDQTFGDASVRYGMADESSFHRMLEAALDEHPDVPVLLKVHPDVISGRKRGHFDRGLTRGAATRVVLLADDVHPPSLIEPALAIYTVTSQMGFEGLLWGKPVRTFGMPFYAGWGLTNDDLPAPQRRRLGHRVVLHDLVHAALVGYPRYLDPERLEPCAPERLMEWMGLQRRMRERFPRQVYGLGFSRWKKPIVRAFMAGSEVRFVAEGKAVPADAAVAVWGCRPTEVDDGLRPPAAPHHAGSMVVRLEDGFLRSVGLGADLVRPLSWVMDRQGLYYDATRPSDLESLLQTTVFDLPLLQRAQALRQRIVTAGLSKYNVGAGGWTRPPVARPVVLVPGQVEADASLRFGAPGIRTNLELLRAARDAAPDAYLVYKPHPDVVARLRRAGVGEAEVRRYCDEVVIDAPIHVVLDAVDELHVLTSLAGFEGLMRGKRVTCHGCPFYAGWGLTQDRVALPRRSRRLSLDELVAAVLILYPTYVSRTTEAFTTPERALDELLAWKARGQGPVPVWRRLLRWALSRRPA